MLNDSYKALGWKLTKIINKLIKKTKLKLNLKVKKQLINISFNTAK
jgi:hypothetical protein